MKQSVLMLVSILLAITAVEAQKGQPAQHEFSVQQCIDYGIKNNAQVKNALLDISIQEQTNRGVASQAYPQISGSLGTTYYPNVAVQTFPNFIAAGVYGVLEQEGVKN